MGLLSSADGLGHPLAKRDGFDIQSASKAFVPRLSVSEDEVYNAGYARNVTRRAFIKRRFFR